MSSRRSPGRRTIWLSDVERICARLLSDGFAVTAVRLQHEAIRAAARDLERAGRKPPTTFHFAPSDEGEATALGLVLQHNREAVTA